MGTPTIGYEGDSTLTRSEVARLQLVEAIDLFVAEKFLAALTLAGAAEEILGKLLVHRLAMPIIKESARAVTQLRGETGLSIMNEKSEKELVDLWNSARNMAKHLVNPDDQSITFNLCDEAYWMIRRALENAERLHIAVVNKSSFENWFIINAT